ncbi:MAG TPA: hypothetical protein VGD37_33435 [Kofleriaceae bacterium]|jgi:hypothetical protein
MIIRLAPMIAASVECAVAEALVDTLVGAIMVGAPYHRRAKASQAGRAAIYGSSCAIPIAAS